MLSDDEVNKLVAGTFELPCLQMTLKQNRQRNAHQYSGPGEIRQDQKGTLNLRLFDQKSGPAPIAHWPAGEFVSAEEYYTLRAVDMGGREWSAMLLPFASRSASGGCEVTGRIRTIENISKHGHERASTVELVIPSQLPLSPTTRTESETTSGGHRTQSFTLDTAVFAAAGFHFNCRTQAKRTDVRAYRETAPPPKHAWVRIIEGLQFLVGRVVQPVVAKVAAGTQERTIVFSTETVRPRAEGVEAPLRPIGGPAAADAWKLFDRYLSYIWTPDVEDFHPLSVAWYPVVSYGGSLETKALIWAVAAEAILKIVDKEGELLPPVLNEDGTRLRNEAEQWLEELARRGLDDHLQERMRGFFKPLFHMNPEGRFKRLAQLGVLSPRLVKSWRWLRHRSAHGVAVRLSEHTEVLRASFSVLELLYQLVFHAVGYSGRCVAYGETEWPNRRYPPP